MGPRFCVKISKIIIYAGVAEGEGEEREPSQTQSASHCRAILFLHPLAGGAQ